MSKTKGIVSTRSIKKPVSSFRPGFVLIFALGIAVLVGGYIYKSMMQKADINMIVGAGSYRPVPLPSATPSACNTVGNISFTSNCGNDSYQYISFKCGQSAKTYTQGGKTSCKSLSTWYQEAQSVCGPGCAFVTPRPSSTPKATPTTGGVCSQEVGNCISQDKICIKYSDSCQKSANCLQPYQACGNTNPIPAPTSTPKPSTTSAPNPSPVPFPTSIR